MVTRRLAALRLFCVPLAFAALIACGKGADEPATGPVVLAASSLQESLEDVGKAWAAEGHAMPVLSFAASSALARQIEQGAPADLFVSADADWMDTLETQRLLRAGTRGDILTNRLVLVTRTGGPVRRLADIDDGRLALADPAAVPAGKYARAALESLGQWQAVEAKVVPAENVRAALALVERGEAPLGIVYATDAAGVARVRVVGTFPLASHPPIAYPFAIVAGRDGQPARALLAFLLGPEARGVYEKRGFVVE